MDVRDPIKVVPRPVAEAVRDIPYWFVIGGQAVRCFCPYRPSRDVDLGVRTAEDLEDLLGQLRARGEVELLERDAQTVHLRFDGVKVSIFVLDRLAPYVEGRRLVVTGVLATKLHAILARGTRRDFFDLYVTLRTHSLGIAECLHAVHLVYGDRVEDGLLLRALTYFDDAEREASLPGEGPRDFRTVKAFFQTRVGDLIVPPRAPLEIMRHVVDVDGS